MEERHIVGQINHKITGDFLDTFSFWSDENLLSLFISSSQLMKIKTIITKEFTMIHQEILDTRIRRNLWQ